MKRINSKQLTSVKTINRFKSRSCPPSSELVKKLIKNEVTNPCPISASRPYENPRPVSIRVCTRSDFEKSLPSSTESCESTSQNIRSDKLSRLVKIFAKSALAAGLVYWTKAEGFWGDGEESEGLYHRINDTVSPAIREAVHLEERKLPHLDNVKYRILDTYNRSVIGFFGFLIGVPIALKKKFFDNILNCDIIDDIENKKKKIK